MTKGTRSSRRSNESGDARGLGDAGAEIVRAAARLLDQEMALGIATAKAVDRRLQGERRVEPDDFTEALDRLRSDARGIIAALDGQLEGARLQENAELARRFVARTNDLLDVAIAFLGTGAELAGELLRANLPAPDPDPAPKPRSRRRSAAP
jgi:hypothetical protein